MLNAEVVTLWQMPVGPLTVPVGADGSVIVNGPANVADIQPF